MLYWSCTKKVANSFIRGLFAVKQYTSNGPDRRSDIHLDFRATNVNQWVIWTPIMEGECRSMLGVINLIHVCNVEHQGLISKVWIFFLFLTHFRSIFFFSTWVARTVNHVGSQTSAADLGYEGWKVLGKDIIFTCCFILANIWLIDSYKNN